MKYILFIIRIKWDCFLFNNNDNVQVLQSISKYSIQKIYTNNAYHIYSTLFHLKLPRSYLMIVHSRYKVQHNVQKNRASWKNLFPKFRVHVIYAYTKYMVVYGKLNKVHPKASPFEKKNFNSLFVVGVPLKF